MNKKTKAALAGLAFFAGCEIGIAIQLMKMIHKFTIRESAMAESVPDEAAEAAAEEMQEEPAGEKEEDVPVEIQAETAEAAAEEEPKEPENETAEAVSDAPEVNE